MTDFSKKRKTALLIGIAAMLLLFALCFRFTGGYGEKILALAGQDAGEHELYVATGRTLGLLSLIPAVLTIVLAFITKEVLLSLFAGLASGAVLLEAVFGSGSLIPRVGYAFDSICAGILTTVTDDFRMSVVILCLAIGGTVAVISASGGFLALGRLLTRGISSPKRATLMAQLMGMCLFFDDYANSLITGPVMRSITDRQGVSREKLAYIVDSTAAPVAGIAIISSWIAAELSAIESGFDVAGVSGSAYIHFINSIPFCFYNFVAISFVLALTLMGREYGPMLKAERRARAGEPLRRGTTADQSEANTFRDAGHGSIWSALIPVLTLIVYAFVGFYVNGTQNAAQAGAMVLDGSFFSSLSTAFACADTVTVLLRASILASLTAIFMACFSGGLGVVEALGAWTKGASELLPTVLVLVLAWALSGMIEQLGTAYYLVDLVTLNLPVWLLPMLIFITCCLISFAAGSFGCMVIVMPIAVPIAYGAAAGVEAAYGQQLIFASIAAVLSGSIFGDHCSPVTDTTILSSMGAGCDNIDHVKTQLPYALTVAAIAAVLGYLPAGLGLSPALLAPVAIGAGLIVIRLAGRPVEPLTKAQITPSDTGE